MSQDHTRLPPTRGEGQGLPSDDCLTGALEWLKGLSEYGFEEAQALLADRERLESLGWRTMDSAPKDGTHILACIAGHSFGWWNGVEAPPVQTVIHWYEFGDESGFYTSVNEQAPDRTFDATHWKPLDGPSGAAQAPAIPARDASLVQALEQIKALFNKPWPAVRDAPLIAARALARFAAGQSLTEASVYGSSPLINEAHPPGGNSHEG